MGSSGPRRKRGHHIRPQRYASFVIAMIIPMTVTTTIATCVQIQLEGTAPPYRGSGERRPASAAVRP
ncbi:MAG TPA: hypothetical protein VFI66_00630 [Gemmatimonadales bacterium]|nr:hypothetical protein [Gemmatimonadales bacterium]